MAAIFRALTNDVAGTDCEGVTATLSVLGRWTHAMSELRLSDPHRSTEPKTDHWSDDIDYPPSEVADSNTRLGYAPWVNQQRSYADELS